SRMRRLGISRRAVTDAIAACRAGSGWQPGAALDAATRAVEAMAAEGGLRTRGERSRALLGLFTAAREVREPAGVVPAEFWTALATGDPATVRLRGAVLV